MKNTSGAFCLQFIIANSLSLNLLENMHFRPSLKKFHLLSPDSPKMPPTPKNLWLFQRNIFFFKSNLRHFFLIFNVFYNKSVRHCYILTYYMSLMTANYPFIIKDGLTSICNEILLSLGMQNLFCLGRFLLNKGSQKKFIGIW